MLVTQVRLDIFLYNSSRVCSCEIGLWFHDENGQLPQNLSTYIEPFPAAWKGGIGPG
jgi:hypothetical protein